MTPVNVNQEGFQRRMDTITSILRSYSLEFTSISPVEYEEDCPFIYNNFIYRIQLSSPVVSSTFESGHQRPGTTAPSKSGASTIIIRLSNPHARGLNNANRVENEVATQYLFRQHLSNHHPKLAHLIPAVYAWEPCRYQEIPDETGFAWTMCEFMPGGNLDVQFAGMELPDKLSVVEQIADIFAALQQTPLPRKLANHLGGLTFDSLGQVIGGQMSILPSGPWDSYTDLWVSRLRQQVHDVENSSVLKGWKEGGIRDRIEKLINVDRIGKLVEGIDTTQRTLVHGDFSMNNMLFDKATNNVTALLDFDFASVTHPAHEFFTGFWDLGGDMRSDDDGLHIAIVTGKFDHMDEALSPEDKIKWQVAKAWDGALATRYVARPSSITGIKKLEKLMTLEAALCPSRLSNEVRIERIKSKSPEKLGELLRAATDDLIVLLDELDSQVI